jgi:hypothetical protein
MKQYMFTRGAAHLALGTRGIAFASHRRWLLLGLYRYNVTLEPIPLTLPKASLVYVGWYGSLST